MEDVRAGRDRADDAGVEHHLAGRVALLIRGLRVRPGVVSWPHDDDRGEVRRRAAQHLGEVGRERRGLVAAMRIAVRRAVERHDGDVLTGAVHVRRIIVERRKLRRKERARPRIGDPLRVRRVTGPARDDLPPFDRAHIAAAKPKPADAPRIETEHALDNSVERLGDVHFADPAAIIVAFGIVIVVEFDAERPVDRSDRARDLEAALGGVGFDHLELHRPRPSLDRLHVLGVGAPWRRAPPRRGRRAPAAARRSASRSSPAPRSPCSGCA